jgi:predicted nucleic acid-binding protein
MTKLLRDTIKQVEQLPDGEQDAAAVAMLDYLAHRRDLRVSDAQIAEIRRRRADPNRKLVSHDEARARIKRLGA